MTTCRTCGDPLPTQCDSCQDAEAYVAALKAMPAKQRELELNRIRREVEQMSRLSRDYDRNFQVNGGESFTIPIHIAPPKHS